MPEARFVTSIIPKIQKMSLRNRPGSANALVGRGGPRRSGAGPGSRTTSDKLRPASNLRAWANCMASPPIESGF